MPREDQILKHILVSGNNHMYSYPAIWRTETRVNSALLLEEFEAAMANQLHTIYPRNVNWTGVNVFQRNKVNHLNALPALESFLELFGRENVLGVTYFNLAPNSDLHRHRDMNGNLLFGVMRLHAPLKTNPKALMEVQKRFYHLPLDTLWVLDTSGLHALQNGGDQNRIHLVIDVRYGASTAKYFPDFSIPVVLHLTRFVFIVLMKVLRDIVTQPASVLFRLRSIFRRFFENENKIK